MIVRYIDSPGEVTAGTECERWGTTIGIEFDADSVVGKGVEIDVLAEALLSEAEEDNGMCDGLEAAFSTSIEESCGSDLSMEAGGSCSTLEGSVPAVDVVVVLVLETLSGMGIGISDTCRELENVASALDTSDVQSFA